MSYDNAEPKVLKTLNSSGQVLDDAGNVINDTSDYWVQLYNQTEPKVDKILKSDGTIVDAAGNLIQDTTEFNVKKYNQAEPTPAKYLHSDGTIDENPGGGGGGSATAYAWEGSDNNEYYYDFSVSPLDATEWGTKKWIKSFVDSRGQVQKIEIDSCPTITELNKISDTEFQIIVNGSTMTFTRDSTKDFTLWQLSE